jgi:hypothetical protein
MLEVSLGYPYEVDIAERMNNLSTDDDEVGVGVRLRTYRELNGNRVSRLG